MNNECHQDVINSDGILVLGFDISFKTLNMKTIYFLSLFIVISLGSFAQSDLQKELDTEEEVPGFDKSKLYFGGYMNLSFGSYTVIGIAPLVGYKFTPEFSTGIGLSYEYSSFDNSSASNYGGSIFSRYRVVPQFYLHAEFSTINYQLFYDFEDGERTWVPFLFLGGGYSQPIAKNVWLNAQVLFDVLQNENSPYESWEPFFSIGFGVGF
ncbi:MAG: hypothetical protein HQ522_22955 [Bacteroidetes bacterium]|nr:hypothetical protein [Bacteroidota bacterium]